MDNERGVPYILGTSSVPLRETVSGEGHGIAQIVERYWREIRDALGTCHMQCTVSYTSGRDGIHLLDGAPHDIVDVFR